MGLDRCVLRIPGARIGVETVRDSKVRRDAMMTGLPMVETVAVIVQDSRVRLEVMTVLRMAEIAVAIVQDSRVLREAMATGLPSVVVTIGQGSKVHRGVITTGLRMGEIVAGIVQGSRVRRGVMVIDLSMVETAVEIVQDFRVRRGAMGTGPSSLGKVDRNIKNPRVVVIGLPSEVARDRHFVVARIDQDSKVHRGAEIDLLSVAGEKIGQDFRVHREAVIGLPSVAVTIGRSLAVAARDRNLEGRPETVEADRLSVVARIARNLTAREARADLVQSAGQDRLHGKRGQIRGRKAQEIDQVRGNPGASLPVRVAENLGGASYLEL